MSETTTTNTDEKNTRIERTNTIDDQNNEGFPAFIVIILLAIIWILTNFTVFVCTAAMILMSKIVTISNSTIRTNNNLINSSPPAQVRMKCSSTMTDDTVSEALTTINDSTRINIKESEAELARDGEQQANDEDIGGQSASSGRLANAVSHLPESDVNQIDKLIISKGTVGVLITSSDDNSTGASNSAQTTTDTRVSGAPLNQMIPTAPTIQKSAFVTENVMKIAVSYSGKERKRVLKIARILQTHMTSPECSHPVFFDKDFQHEVCRINGLSHLLSIYRQAQLVIVFLSPTYTDSRYCSGEWRTIAQRFLSNRKNKEATQLLLVKLGQYDMEQLDLVDSDFTVNGMRMSNEEIAQIILRRWNIVEKNLAQ